VRGSSGRVAVNLSAKSHEDLFVTPAAAAGLPNLIEDLLNGYKMGDMTYKVHLNGYNNLDYWTGKSQMSARRAIRKNDYRLTEGARNLLSS
jgi:hypothetical protein